MPKTKGESGRVPVIHKNTHRQSGIGEWAGALRTDPAPVQALLADCPAHKETPLREATELARDVGVGALFIKDERGRMGLGSFKALGAAHAIARDAQTSDAQQKTYVAASAGNHGMSVAAGAAVFGARAVIYLAETVPEAFADRLRDKGAEVVRQGATYEESMAAAETAAEENGWILLSDSTWEGYTEPALAVMEGYLQMAAEAATQIGAPPTHILLQAGVGGLAAAVAGYARRVWADGPTILVIEPDAAAALTDSVRAGELVTTEGPVSSMGRLDCKTPSMVALSALARDADYFVTISEAEARAGVARLADHGFDTTPSGGAGLAALIAGLEGMGTDARVLAFMSEGPEDG